MDTGTEMATAVTLTVQVGRQTSEMQMLLKGSSAIPVGCRAPGPSSSVPSACMAQTFHYDPAFQPAKASSPKVGVPHRAGGGLQVSGIC